MRLNFISILLISLTTNLVLAQEGITIPSHKTTLIKQFKKHISTLADEKFEGREPMTKGDTLTTEYILNELKDIPHLFFLGDKGLQKVEFTTRRRGNDTIPQIKVTNNIVSMIKAPVENNPQDEAIIIGAHFDHMGMMVINGKIEMFPGADDNASGVATLIEFARHISSRAKELQRDVIFIFFAAEEQGLVGSNYYTNNSLLPLSDIKAMFNFDMTGRMVSNTINVRGIGVVAEAFSQLSTLPNPDLLNINLVMSGQEGTDYASFNRKGIPSLSFSTGRSTDFHKPGDTEDKIDYNGMVKLFDFVKPLISRMAFEKGTFTYINR